MVGCLSYTTVDSLCSKLSSTAVTDTRKAKEYRAHSLKPATPPEIMSCSETGAQLSLKWLGDKRPSMGR